MWIQPNDSAQKGDQEQKTDDQEGGEGVINKSNEQFPTFDAPGRRNLTKQLSTAANQSTDDDVEYSSPEDKDEDYKNDGYTPAKEKKKWRHQRKRTATHKIPCWNG